MRQREIREICEKVLDMTRAKSAQVLVHTSHQGLSRLADNRIIQSVENLTDSINLSVRFGSRLGRASSTSLDTVSLERLVRRAEELARASMPDRELLPLLGAREYPEIKAYFPATARFGPESRARMAGRIIDQARRERLVAAGALSIASGQVAIANSRGLFAFHQSTNASISITMMGKDASGWAAGTHRDINALDPDALIARAVDKALAGKKPRAVKPGRYTVLLEPAAVSALALFLAHTAFNGLALWEKRSCFSGMQGKKVAGRMVTFQDNAQHELQRGMPFDWDGAARRQVTMIDRGVFCDGVYDRLTAKKAGVRPTGHGLPQPNPHGAIPMNMVMEPGVGSVDELVSNIERGILVTQLHYTNIINPKTMNLTGMTRNGTFMIEKGRIKYPVRNLRFTERLPRALKNIIAVGSEAEKASSLFGGGIVVPPVVIRDFTFSSGTDF